ncbi:hypothetical protein ACFL0V_07410, partial [Nanoarchaeota archaeon]
MLVKKIIELLEKRDEFLEWRKDHPLAYLAHVLIMVEPKIDHKFDIGYFDSEKEKMTTFLVDRGVEELEMKKDQDVFKDPKHPIRELDREKIKTGYEVALELASDVQKTKYG